MDLDELGLTNEQIDKVNKIIIGIQSDLDSAIKSLEQNNYDQAISFVEEGLKKSNCPVCKKQLGILKADIEHNKAICILDEDSCRDETPKVIESATVLKEEFVPVTNAKKAAKEAKKERVAKVTDKLPFLGLKLPPLIKSRREL